MSKRDHYLDNLGVEFNGHYNEEGIYQVVSEDGFTYSEVLASKAEEKSRLDAVGNTYQKADSIITGEPITVTVVNDPKMTAPATNNGREITFNANLIKELNTESIVSLNGINYHELAHLLFSPRAGSALGQYVTKGKMKRAFNMLEEARIETLLVAKYPAVKPFLEANAIEYVLKAEDIADNFPMVTGRRYIDLDIRQSIADAFVNKYGKDVADNIYSIVNEYRSLSFPTDFTRGMELIADYTRLVGHDEQTPTKPNGEGGTADGDGNHNDRDVLGKGRPASAKEQKRLQDKENGCGLGEAVREGDEQGATNGDTKQAQPSNGVGGDAIEVKADELKYSNADSDIANKLKERMKEINRDERVKSEVREVRKSITGNDETRDSLDNAKSFDSTVTIEGSTFARRFGQTLERLVRDADPYWDRFLPSGKLNVSRTMTPDVNAIGQMFDQWDTGSDNTDIESVILLDNSGSMGGHMNKVCESAWIIKRGIEYIDGSVTVFNFNSDSELLYHRKDRAKPTKFRSVHSRGSTNPLKALVESERIFNTSDKSVKIAFIVTDGEWEHTSECDDIIARLNKNGVITCVVYIGNYEYAHELIKESKAGNAEATHRLKSLTHKAKMFHSVTKPKDVLGIATELVKSKVGK
jgi:hypothetical protein